MTNPVLSMVDLGFEPAVLPPRRNSLDFVDASSIEEKVPLSFYSPTVAPLAIFSQPIDVQPLQPLQSLASLQLSAFGSDTTPGQKFDGAENDFSGSTMAPGAGKWESAYTLPENVLIRSPLDQVHQMVPCTPGPATVTASQACVETALGALDNVHRGHGDDANAHATTNNGLYPLNHDDFFANDDKAAQAYLFGSSDEDAVSGEVQLNHVTGHDLYSHDPFLEGSSPAMIHLAGKSVGKCSKKSKGSRVRAAERARSLLGGAPAAVDAVNTADTVNTTSKRLKDSNTNKTSKLSKKAAVATKKSTRVATMTARAAASAAAKDAKAPMSKRRTRNEADSAGDIDGLSSQDLKTPVASQQSTGSRSQRSTGKKATKKSLAGRPLNTPIVKKIKKSEGTTTKRRAPMPWVLNTVVCPRTGHILAAGQVPPAEWCTQCMATSTPVWRAGPFGHKTLCNACGVRWMKQLPVQNRKK